MKREGIRHPKAIDLAHRLGVPLYQVTGLLTHLWAFASEYTPDGEIGRYAPGVVVSYIGYEGDPDQLFRELCESNLLDICDGKTVIHHWPDHCEDSVHRRLARAGKTFWDGTVPNLSRLSGRERIEAEKRYSVRTKCAQSAPGVRPKCARNAPLPLPLPLPDPDPDLHVCNRGSTTTGGGVEGEGGGVLPIQSSDTAEQPPQPPLAMPENRALAGQGGDTEVGVVCPDVQNAPGASQAVFEAVPDPPKIDPDREVYDAWNDAAARSGLTAAAKLTTDRRSRIKSRLSDPWWRDHWRAGLAAVEASDFHRGINNRRWRANLDWFLRPSTVTKMVESENNKPMFAGKVYKGDIDSFGM